MARLSRRGRGRPWSRWALALALVFGGYSYIEERGLREDYSYAGLPRMQRWTLENWTRIFRNEGYMLGYAELRRNPLWVTYRLKHSSAPQQRGERGAFHADWRSFWQVEADDYTRSGYDRGHLAPNHAIGLVYGPRAQRETFLMTNISPQRKALNQKLWQRLEELTTDYFLRRFSELWVVTGPVFDAGSQRLASGVKVPTAFYKILLAPRGSGAEPLALAFLMPQSVKGNEPLDRYVVSIDVIEGRTGLDFFHRLEDGVESQLEAGADTAPWGLARVARRAPRY